MAETNNETFDLVGRSSLQEIWARAKAKFFIKGIGDTDTDRDKTLWQISQMGNVQSSNVGILRRAIGNDASEATGNVWLLDSSEYLIGVSASAGNGLTITRVTGYESQGGAAVQQTATTNITAATLRDALSLGAAAILDTGTSEGDIPILGASGKLALSVFPDAIFGQVVFGGTVSSTEGTYPIIGNTYITANAKAKIEQKTGKTIGTRKLQLVNVPQSQAETWTTSTAYVGYDTCEGIYFIFSVTGPFTFAGEEYNVGDWIISTGSAWKKVDNTDAVTGIKFVRNGVESVEIGEVTVSCDKIGALNLFATTPQNMLGDLIVGTSSSRKSIAAYGGMAAHGIGDLTSGGGGGGTSGVDIMLDWTNYTGADTEVLSSRLGIKGMTLTASKLTLTKGNNTVIEQNVPAWNQNTTGNAATADKVNHALTFGSKTYDGSAAKTLLLSDLATYSNNKYAINISGNADTATNATNATNAANYANSGTIKDFVELSSSVMQSLQSQLDSIASRTHFDELLVSVLTADVITAGTVYGAFIGDISGNANTATKLTNARKITIGRTYNLFDGSGDISYNLSDVGALDLFTTTKQTMLGDLEIGTSSSAKGLSAWGGVAAHGIGDLTSGGGGGGTVGISVLRDWANYDSTDETQVLGTNLAKAMKDNVTTEETTRKANDVNNVKIGGIRTRLTATPAMVTAISETDADTALRFGRSDGTHLDVKRGTAVDITATNIYGLQVNDDAEFTRRTTCDDKNVGGRSAKFLSIKGNTIVWNQLLNKDRYPTTTVGTVTFTNNGDGSISVQNNVEGSIDVSVNLQNISFLKNHKYLLSGGGDADCYIIVNSINVTGTWITTRLGPLIFDAIEGVSAYIRIRCLAKLSDTRKFIPQLIDLTQMFGAGNEPTSVEEFKALFPNDYYPYNAGQLLSLTAQKFMTDGFNQWEGETKYGSHLSESSTYYWRSKNLVPVIPSATYYLFLNGYADFANLSIQIYNSKGSWLQELSRNKVGDGYMFTIPANGSYMNFEFYRATPYANLPTNIPLCINLSWSGVRNGEYEPHWKGEKALPSKSAFDVTYTGADGQTRVAGGRKAAGAAYDEQTPTKDVRRVAVVDLGALNWSYISALNSFGSNDITNAKSTTRSYHNTSILVKNYEQVYEILQGSTQNNVYTLASGAHGTKMLIKDTSYGTDVAAFKTAMAGVLLYYELAEPVVTEYDEPRDPNYRVDDFGTESIAPLTDEDGSPATAPLRADIEYGIDARREVEMLPAKYLQKENFNIYADKHSNMEIYAESATDEPTGMTLKIGDKEIDVRVLTDEEIDQICN